MASNEIPKNPNRLTTLAEDAADGAQALGQTIGLQQNTETAIRADLAAFLAAQSAFQAARSTKSTRSTARTVADSNAKAFLAAAKNVLMVTIGRQWNTEWAAAGWDNPSLALPTTSAARLTHLAALKAYLAANPAKENAPLGVTSAAAEAVHSALSAARGSANDGNAASGQAKAARDGAQEKLRQRLIALVAELKLLLSDDDPRWYAFGLNAPADPETPAIPTGLVLTPGATPGSVLADWDDARAPPATKSNPNSPQPIGPTPPTPKTATPPSPDSHPANPSKSASSPATQPAIANPENPPPSPSPDLRKREIGNVEPVPGPTPGTPTTSKTGLQPATKCRLGRTAPSP